MKAGDELKMGHMVEHYGNTIYLSDNMVDLSLMHGMIVVPGVVEDFITSLCGKQIGDGTSRVVFEHNLNPRYVVKVEPRNSRCNIVEAMIWDEVCGLKENLSWVRDWFAPVVWLSPNGRILVMKRTYPKESKKKPVMVPSFLWDVNSKNFGWIGNKFVCHDYGQFYNFIHYSSRMKKAHW